MSRQDLFLRLRADYPLFEYREAQYRVEADGLHLSYHFEVPGLGAFRPSLRIPLIQPWENSHPQVVERLVFLIGMVELISYWKAAASPKIRILAGALNPAECAFWKRLYWGGLGEYFFVNGIETTEEAFVQLEPTLVRPNLPFVSTLLEVPPQEEEGGPILIPVGGGKDSVVTLEALRDIGVERIGFAVNPNDAVRRCMDCANLNGRVEVQRRLDPFLLELNQRGFLNGHTPFSALLGFVSLLCAYLLGATAIALSNEGSANESTVHDAQVNHQFSKTTAFEAAFQNYIANQIGLKITYFSFLRPMSELAIARCFARHKAYHDVFRSCNRGARENRWCGRCPKCLFVALMLAPFVGVEAVEEWMGPILSDPERLSELRELAGMTPTKPFECVGTVAEVRMALALLSRRVRTNRPLLLEFWYDWVRQGLVTGEALEGEELRISKEDYQRLFGCYYKSDLFPSRWVSYLPTQYGDGLEEALQLPWAESERNWEVFLKQDSDQSSLLARMEADLRAQPSRQLILGFGREGRTWLQVLAQSWAGREVSCEIGIADANPIPPAVRSWAESLGLPLKWHIGGDPLEVLDEYSICYKSPGISFKTLEPGDEIGSLRTFPTVRVQNQMDWFLRFQSKRTIGVTGSKGKSTTTSLVDAMLSQEEESVYLLGNIGRAVFDVAPVLKSQDAVALELSCHQLEHTFHAPHVAVLTNVYPEHLDHYRSFEDYREAKFHLLTYQQAEDWAVLPDDDTLLQALSGRVPSQTWLVTERDLSLDTLRNTHPSYCWAGICRIQKPERASVLLSWQVGADFQPQLAWVQEESSLLLEGLPPSLQGQVHAWDYGFSATAVRCFGLSSEAIRQGVRLFQGLPHRCSWVGTWNGIGFVNDSISTIPATCLGAIELLKPSALFVGGMDRGVDLEPLISVLETGRVPLVLCMPDTGKQIAERLKDCPVEVRIIETLEEGVDQVFERLKPGATALFSPAAASYHLYRNFEDRGHAFEEAVLRVAQIRGFSGTPGWTGQMVSSN